MRKLGTLWSQLLASSLALCWGCAALESGDAHQSAEEVVGSESQALKGDGSSCNHHHGLSAEERRAQVILSKLTLAEKAGQMVQADLTDVAATLEQGLNVVRDLALGSVLSGGNSQPTDNTPPGWHVVYDELQGYAHASSSHIPLIYGIDGVHGSNPIRGATVFPHNIGLGATRDPGLAYDVGRIAAREMASTGVDWTFAPCVAVARDERWGRSYESYGETPELQRLLAGPQVWGFQGLDLGRTHVVATAKHFIGDGGTTWGTGAPRFLPDFTPTDELQIDQGDTRLDSATLKAIHARGYVEAIKAGVGTVMNSFSSVNGLKMSAHKELITGYLKGDPSTGGLGFTGFVVSDWNSIEGIPVSDATDPLEIYKSQLIQSIDAGVDMFMVIGTIGSEYKIALASRFIQEAVAEGKLTEARINDAVSRILRIKIKAGLFEKFDAAGQLTPEAKQVRDELTQEFGSDEHRQVARKVVQRSLVLLKNERHTLPISARKYDTIYVVGKNADNFGADCGGWTYSWQGVDGNALKAEKDRTILDGINALAAEAGLKVVYSANAQIQVDSARALAVAVIGEAPYAEGFGDARDLSLDEQDRATLNGVYATGLPVAVVMVSGRPRIVTDDIEHWNAFVAAWLPGSQADGVADALFGKVNFTGRLPMTWPKTMDQIPINVGDGQKGLFEYGFGLSYRR